MAETIIAWTDFTFNPWMGCTKVSPGCKNCYAETLTKNRMGLSLWGPQGRRQVTKTPWDNLRKLNREAVKSGEVKKVFCGSLCDWAEDHPIAEATRPRLWEAIRQSTGLVFQMLTKRPERIKQLLPPFWDAIKDRIWLGTSIENAEYASRADEIRNFDSAVRFISYEPALGPLGDIDLTKISWVIYGGESGPGYRSEDKQWARDIMARCRQFGTAFFHKQSAGYRTEMGIELDGQIIREYPVGALVGARLAKAAR